MSAAGFSNAGQPSSTGSDSVYEERDHNMPVSVNTSTTMVSAEMEPDGQQHRRSNYALSVSNAFQFSGGKTRCTFSASLLFPSLVSFVSY